MLVRFFFNLRGAGVPVSIGEFLSFLEGLKARVASLAGQDFYHLARLSLVKDERYFDRFDRVFGEFFAGAEAQPELLMAALPGDWLESLATRLLSAEERRRIAQEGGWQQLLATLRQLAREQSERHAGGAKWIGTGGSSPFGNSGFHPAGVRLGPQVRGNHRAVKVWQRRDYRNFDGSVELGTRNFKLALRRLRRFARAGAAQELDLDATIAATARNAGWLDLKMRPERRNAMKLLLFLDVGGSMEPHVGICERLFSAARAEFRHLEHFYFHNFLYERVWRDNPRLEKQLPTLELIRTYGAAYRVIFVGDATMSPYEILRPGGSIEHWNPETGKVWVERLRAAFPRLIWLNPEPVARWDHTPSIRLTRELLGERMYPLTLEGLERGIAELRKAAAPQGLDGRRPVYQ